MATPESDLALKLKHEKRLRGWGSSFAAALARRIKNDLRRGVVTPLGGIGEEMLRAQLREHYEIVSRDFDHQMSDALPDDLKPGQIEQGQIRTVLAQMFTSRSNEVSSRHMANAQDLLTWSVARARRIIRDDDDLKDENLPVLAANTFLTRERARMNGLAIAETQYAAEQTKGIEVLALVGQLTGEQKLDGQAIKTWRSQGDSRVRRPPQSQFDHSTADGQRVLTNEPFVVSGQLMRWPGDTAMGATSGNVMGCRCSAIYDVESVTELRRLFVQTIAADTAPPFPVTESDEVVSIDFDAGQL